MKYFFYLLLLLLLFSVHLKGQDPRSSRLNDNLNSNEPDQIKSAKQQKPVVSAIKAWTLDQESLTPKSATVDTTTHNFHIYNPIFQKSISNTYLGFTGSAYQSNIFFERDQVSDFYFVRNFNAYRRPQSDVSYFNTTTPFASLMYVQSGAEQLFKAFFTQNIDSVTNFGFRFNAQKNESQYKSLEGQHKFLNLFASRNSERYNGYINFVNGTDAVIENGGISSKTIDRSIPASYFPINLSNQLEATTKSFILFTSHEYLMGKIPHLNKAKRDTTIVAFVPKYGIQYSAEVSKYNRDLVEPTINATFFDTAYINTKNAHTDSSSFFRFLHILQLKALEDSQRKFTFGKRVFLENEIVSAVHPLHSGQRTYSYSNIYAGGEIYRKTSDFWQWSALARFAFLGRNLGDALVKGTIIKPFIILGDTTNIKVELWYQDRSSDIFQDHWFSNHFKWENNFKKQHEVVIKGQYHFPSIRASAGVNYSLLSNYLYNNNFAIPSQFDKEFSIFSGWLNKDFHLGRFGWSNKAVWQELSNDEVLHLPVWSFYSSIFYSHYLFKVMKIQLGAEIYYHSTFYADRYEPSTTQFYLQNEIKTGGYPLINLFANAKLKRTSAFVVLTHANSMFNFGDYFSSPSYPLEQMVLKFGFLWTFYD